MPRSPRILSWRWGRVVVDAAAAPFRDAMLFPGGAREWDWRPSGTRHVRGIQPADVNELLNRGARVVVLSRDVLGALRVAPETRAVLESRGAAVEVLPTPAAIARYNHLAETEQVGALIHSTC